MSMILVTGGAGYIGSHTCVTLLENHHDVVVVDNLMNSSEEAINRVRHLTGCDVPFYNLDVCDEEDLETVFDAYPIDAVIHFAGLKAVGESVQQPLRYYQNNLDSTLTLCEVMSQHGVKKLVFSSSATVYGLPESVPIHEDEPLKCTNPYGWTKMMNEQILRDLAAADPSWSIMLLRYFNPVGAHESGLIGEDPLGIPNNLMPALTQVAIGRQPVLHIFGSDYDTIDGTGVRDYIHVVDLSEGHVSAINAVLQTSGIEAVNLGTGTGYSVLEMVHAFEAASGRTIPVQFDSRRPGDIGLCYADPAKANRLLNWHAKKSLSDMCADAWRWQHQNPYGYRTRESSDGADR